MTPTPEGATPQEAIEAAAASWLSLRDRGMSPEETAAFLLWLQADPRHAEVFAELDRVWQRFNRLQGAAAPATPAAPDADVLAPRPTPRRRRLPLGWGAAAAAVLVLTLSISALLRGPQYAAETEVGAFRRIDLPDGSVAQLNTDSALDVDFTETERRVRIVRGEVFFTVAKDPSKPFLVAAGPVVVRAVGTAFNVRHRAEGVEVLVTEGRVAVAPATPQISSAEVAPVAVPELAAGERTVVAVPRGASTTQPAPTAPVVERVSAPAMQRALAWQERRLDFDEMPLAEVIREFNRYNRSQLVIQDAALGARRFTGEFRADGQEAFVRLLATDFGVRVERRGRDLLLHPDR